MKAEESVTNYFSYVKNVLGVRTILSAKIRDELASAAESSVEHCDLLFLNIKVAHETSVLSGESKELLDKMIQAMRLGQKSFVIHEIELPNSAAINLQTLMQSVSARILAPFVVVFTAKPQQNGILQNLGTQTYLETFSPSYLVKNANTKKVVWTDLQKVMKEIGIA